MCTSQFNCLVAWCIFDTISNRLWCHQLNGNQASETQVLMCVKNTIFIVIDGLVMLCKNEIMYFLSRQIVALTQVLFWCLFALQLGEIETKITLSHTHKQFTTWVHTSFYIYWLPMKIMINLIFTLVPANGLPSLASSGTRRLSLYEIWYVPSVL